ncbi:MAG: hypothetical protein WBC92_09710 [Terracidiphilus sp.]
MIGWIIGIVTFILLLFVFWQKASKTFRDRVEEPKFLFLERLGISLPHDQPQAPTDSSQEDKKNGSAHS